MRDISRIAVVSDDEFEREGDAAIVAADERAAAGDGTPRFSGRAGSYVCEWADPTYVRIEFERFDANPRGTELSAQIDVIFTAPGLARALSRNRRVNLYAPRSLDEFAKHVEQRFPEPRAFRELLGAAVDLAIEAHRAGEPAVLLREVPAPESSGALLPHVLDGPGVGTFHFGMGGVGKGLEALAAAAAIEDGRADILGIAPRAKRHVGWLNFENDAWEPRERLEMLTGRDEMPEIVHVECVGAIWDQLDRLKRIIRDERLQIVVIDSVGMACGGLPPETSEAALRFNTAFRELHVPGVLLGHQTRNGERSDDYPFGSIFWHNAARATWLVKREGMPGSSSFSLALINKKSNRGPFVPPLAFDVSFVDGRLRFRRRDGATVPLAEGAMPLRWRLREALRRHAPRTIVELADELEADAETIGRTLRRYGPDKAPQDFVKVSSPDGVYRWANVELGASA